MSNDEELALGVVDEALQAALAVRAQNEAEVAASALASTIGSACGGSASPRTGSETAVSLRRANCPRGSTKRAVSGRSSGFCSRLAGPC